MPLNAATMGSAMKSAIDGLSDEDKADRSAVFEAMAQAIIAHITANAVVSVTVATTGTAAAQTGTGTGTVA